MTPEQRATLEHILDRYSANVAYYATTRNAEAAERIVSTQAELVEFVESLVLDLHTEAAWLIYEGDASDRQERVVEVKATEGLATACAMEMMRRRGEESWEDKGDLEWRNPHRHSDYIRIEKWWVMRTML